MNTGYFSGDISLDELTLNYMTCSEYRRQHPTEDSSTTTVDTTTTGTTTTTTTKPETTITTKQTTTSNIATTTTKVNIVIHFSLYRVYSLS